MRALTIWQPWPTLIMIGAKPFEFRRWDYRTRNRAVEGQRIVVHAGARPMRLDEIDDIIDRMGDGISSLRADIAIPLLTRIKGAYKGHGVVYLGEWHGQFPRRLANHHVKDRHGFIYDAIESDRFRRQGPFEPVFPPKEAMA